MYVGGLFGRIDSGNASLTIDNNASNVDITITTTNSYYIGGLIGKLYVNSGNQFNGIIANNALTIVGDDAQNFGGLVGMLKCVGGNGNDKTYSVQGTHYYPFTVNTIENQNYADGESQFSTAVAPTDDSVQLHAQAYYINQDTFNISATNNEAIYGSDPTTAKNPVRGDSKGWAKEYTGFKQIQRCIPGMSVGGADSIAFVYNAENITHVATLKNTYDLSTVNTGDIIKHDDKGYYYEGDSRVDMDEDFIIYTVYERYYGDSFLYCPMGIAELAKDVNGQPITDRTDDFTRVKENEYSHNQWENDSRKGLSEYYWKRSVDDPLFAGTNEESGKCNDKPLINYHPNDPEWLLYFNWELKESYNEDEFDRLTNICYYYPYNEKTYVQKQFGPQFAYYYKIGDKYFDFKVIYTNSSVYGLADDIINATSYPSNSGSVFEVASVNPRFEYSPGVEYSPEKPWWAWVLLGLAALAVIVGYVAGFFTGGASAAAATVVAKIAFGVAIGFGVAGAICQIISDQKNANGLANEESSKLFFSTTDQNLGLLASTTITEVRYKDGSMVASAENLKTFVDVNGVDTYDYQFISKTRPTDFYSSYYVREFTEAEKGSESLTTISVTKSVDYSELCDAETNPEGRIHPLTVTVSGEEKQLLYKYEYKASATETVNAYPKYVYSEGSYYMSTLSFKYGYYQTQELTNFNDVKYPGASEALNAAEIHYSSSGLAYVRGDYHPEGNTIADKYTYNQYGGNLMTPSFTLNETPLNNAAYCDTPVEFVSTEIIDDDVDSDGYNYMVGAYYTTLATPTNNNNHTRYATYKYDSSNSTIQTGWTEGEDYITASYTLVTENSEGNYYYDGSTYKEIDSGYTSGQKYNLEFNKTVVLTLQSMATSGTENRNTNLGYITNFNTQIGNVTVVLKAYPASFKNPYTISVSEEQVKDNYVYENINIVDNTKKSNPAITETVRYFYFENGYKKGSDLGLTGDFANSVFVDAKLTKDDKNDSIKLYYYNGTEYGSVSLGQLFFSGDDIASVIGPSYTNLYTVNPTDAGEMADMYKVSNMYAIYNDSTDSKNYVYMRKDVYSVRDGKLHKMYKYNSSADSDILKENRYLSNKKWDLYTMFVYYPASGDAYNFEFTEGTTKWHDADGKPYYLIPIASNRSRPNQLTTYLVETAKVTLGGGLTLEHTGRGNKTSGSINVSTYSVTSTE